MDGNENFSFELCWRGFRSVLFWRILRAIEKQDTSNCVNRTPSEDCKSTIFDGRTLRLLCEGELNATASHLTELRYWPVSPGTTRNPLAAFSHITPSSIIVWPRTNRPARQHIARDTFLPVRISFGCPRTVRFRFWRVQRSQNLVNRANFSVSCPLSPLTSLGNFTANHTSFAYILRHPTSRPNLT